MSKNQYYRIVHNQFWTDSKVDDSFTPEDKYFYLYLLTNPHTNICGCYEISMKQFTRETGYNEDTIDRLLDRFEKVHDVIRYNSKTKEVLVLKWYKYNWTKSPTLVKGVLDVAKYIKTDSFRDYIFSVAEMVQKNIDDTVSIPYPYPMDTSVSVSVIDNTYVSSNKEDVSIKGTEEKKDKKEKKEHVDVFAEFAMGDEELLNALREFEAMRKRQKKPIDSDRAKKMLIHELEKYPSTEWIPMIDQSIFRGWTSVYPLKTDGETTPRGRYANSKAAELDATNAMGDAWALS